MISPRVGRWFESRSQRHRERCVANDRFRPVGTILATPHIPGPESWSSNAVARRMMLLSPILCLPHNWCMYILQTSNDLCLRILGDVPNSRDICPLCRFAVARFCSCRNRTRRPSNFAVFSKMAWDEREPATWLGPVYAGTSCGGLEPWRGIQPARFANSSFPYSSSSSFRRDRDGQRTRFWQDSKRSNKASRSCGV